MSGHQQSQFLPDYHEGEIWWATFESSFGYEESGKGANNERPVVIVHGFNEHLVWIVPLSTTNKRNQYYFPFVSKPGTLSVAILSQLRSFDTLRLLSLIGSMKPDDFTNLKARLIAIMQG